MEGRTSVCIVGAGPAGRTQQFSDWMLSLLQASVSHRVDGEPGEPSDFAYRLRRARLQDLIDDPNLSRWFAYAYAGVDA